MGHTQDQEHGERLDVRLETGEAKILCNLTLGEVNTNIGTSCALMTVQDDTTLKRCKATEEMEKDVMANAGSTAMPQYSTDEIDNVRG